MREKRKYTRKYKYDMEHKAPLNLDGDIRKLIRVEVSIPLMIKRIIESECRFLGVTEADYITSLIVNGMKRREDDKEKQFKQFLERNRQQDENSDRVQLQHPYEQLGSKS